MTIMDMSVKKRHTEKKLCSQTGAFCARCSVYDVLAEPLDMSMVVDRVAQLSQVSGL